MDKFRYGISVSALFDDELDDETEGVPAAVLESVEVQSRLSDYTRIRKVFREMMFRAPDVPADVDRQLRLRIREHRYKLLHAGNEKISFALVTIGRIVRRRIGNRMR